MENILSVNEVTKSFGSLRAVDGATFKGPYLRKYAPMGKGPNFSNFRNQQPYVFCQMLEPKTIFLTS